MTLGEALRHATARLRAAGIAEPTQDAARLVCHATGLSRLDLTVKRDAPMTEAARLRLDAAIEARAEGRPVAQIIGTRSFFGRSFRVTSDTLDPRPETEILVEAALAAPFDRVLDLGTGTGCILLSVLAEAARRGWVAKGVGTDISAEALAVARDNANALGLQPELHQGDWWRALPAGTGRFDLILSNPPYIAEAEMAGLDPALRFEPRHALTPGGDGLDAYRAIIDQLHGWLTPNGRALFEIGPSQGKAVSSLLAQAGMGDIAIHPDLDGRDRVVSARAQSQTR